MKRLLQSTLPTLAFVSFPPVFQAIDIYFVRLLLPDRPELTGVYVALASIAKIPYFLFFPFTTALVPRFAQYFHTQNLVQIQKTQRSVDGILLLVLLPTVVLGSVFSTDLLLLFYPDSYATGAMAFCFLLAGTAFVALSENALLPYFAYGRYNVVLQHVLASLALAFVLLLVLVPKYELIGASASILISSLLLFLLTRLRSRQTFQLSFPFARLPALLGAATLSGSLAFFLPKGIEWLLPSAAISLAAYILCLVLFRGFSNEEREKLSSLVTTLTERIRR